MNREELDALYGYDEFLFKLYCAGIRRYMDYATGIVGIKRAISYQSLIEVMYIEPTHGIYRGRTSGSPTKKQIIRGIETLGRIGLLIKLPAEKKLIFKLPLATRDNSVQNQLGTNWAYESGTEWGTAKSAENPSATDIPKPQLGRELGIPKNAQLGTPPYIRNKKKKDITNVISKKEKLSTDLQLPDWLPKASWEDYVSHRIEIKKPLSEKAKALSINRLQKFKEEGQSPVEVINQSIMNGWQGLFSVKGETNGKPKHKPAASHAIENILCRKYDISYD